MGSLLGCLRKYCDVHIAASVQKSTLDLVSDDTTGLIATSLCQTGAGQLAFLRDILRQIISDELIVQYVSPPLGRVAEYRQEVHDVFLQMPPLNSSSNKRSAVVTAMRRYVLQSLFNGDLEDTTGVYHYCSFGCCSGLEETTEKFLGQGTWALLPSKAPIFVKAKWLRQEGSLDWSGLLAAHHNLLEKVLVRFTGKPVAATPATIPDASPIGWDFLGETVGIAKSIQDPLPDNAGFVPVEELESFDDLFETDWAARNKQYKQKCGSWACSNPGPRISVVKQLVNVTSHLLHSFLEKSGKEWQQKQAMKSFNEARTYRILEAALDKDTGKCLRDIGELLRNPPKAVPYWACTLRLRALSFRVLSRAACAAHVLLRCVRRQHPYKLFKRLVSPEADLGPSCMYDELTTEFVRQYPSWTPAAAATLHAMADQIELDIASLESRHSSIRRLVESRGVHTWIPNFEMISGEFVCRQIAINQKEFGITSDSAEEPQGQPCDKPRNKKTNLILI